MHCDLFVGTEPILPVPFLKGLCLHCTFPPIIQVLILPEPKTLLFFFFPFHLAASWFVMRRARCGPCNYLNCFFRTQKWSWITKVTLKNNVFFYARVILSLSSIAPKVCKDGLATLFAPRAVAKRNRSLGFVLLSSSSGCQKNRHGFAIRRQSHHLHLPKFRRDCTGIRTTTYITVCPRKKMLTYTTCTRTRTYMANSSRTKTNAKNVTFFVLFFCSCVESLILLLHPLVTGVFPSTFWII